MRSLVCLSAAGVRLGARVIAMASTAEKLQAARSCGAVECIDSTSDDLKTRVTAITAGALVDVVYDVVGGDVAERCLGVVKPGGRLLVIGFAGGRVQSVPANILLVKGVDVVGVRAGAELQRQPQLAEDARRSMAELTAGPDGRALAPLIDCEVEAARAADAYRRIAQRAVIGKAVVTWNVDAMRHERRRREQQQQEPQHHAASEEGGDRGRSERRSSSKL